MLLFCLELKWFSDIFLFYLVPECSQNWELLIAVLQVICSKRQFSVLVILYYVYMATSVVVVIVKSNLESRTHDKVTVANPHYLCLTTLLSIYLWRAYCILSEMIGKYLWRRRLLLYYLMNLFKLKLFLWLLLLVG